MTMLSCCQLLRGAAIWAAAVLLSLGASGCCTRPTKVLEAEKEMQVTRVEAPLDQPPAATLAEAWTRKREAALGLSHGMTESQVSRAAGQRPSTRTGLKDQEVVCRYVFYHQEAKPTNPVLTANFDSKGRLASWE